MGATQLQALIVSRSVGPFWHAHMDASKEGKKKGGSSKGRGLLRVLLTEHA